MLTAGDELGRTQRGNNNPYCLDDATSWVDWDLAPWQQDLLETTRRLIAVRRALPALRQRTWGLGHPVDEHGTLDLEWYAEDGRPMADRWSEPGRRLVQMRHAAPRDGESGALVVVNGGTEPADVVLPDGAATGGYRLLWDSDWPRPPADEAPAQVPAEATVVVPAASIRVYAVVPPRLRGPAGSAGARAVAGCRAAVQP